MNQHQHRSSRPQWRCDRVHSELGAWSLGALEPEETQLVDNHLGQCDACSREADHWKRVTAMLPFGSRAVSPSIGAKRALMARVADDQLATAMPVRPISLALARREVASQSVTTGRKLHWSQLLVAPLALALLVMSLWSLELRDQLDDTRDARAEVTSAILPEGFQAFQLTSDCEQCDTAGHLLADPDKSEALMLAWNLNPGENHEVWCEEGDGSRALVANLQVGEAGEVMQSLAFDQPISGYKRIYVIGPDGELVEIKGSDLTREPAPPGSAPTDIQ